MVQCDKEFGHVLILGFDRSESCYDIDKQGYICFSYVVGFGTVHNCCFLRINPMIDLVLYRCRIEIYGGGKVRGGNDKVLKPDFCFQPKLPFFHKILLLG